MAPRLRINQVAPLFDQATSIRNSYVCARCSYATAAAVAVPAPTEHHLAASRPHLSPHHPLQPPSHRSPSYRKAQMLRSYVSILQTTPLILFFQHNNLKALEWAAIRRELSRALSKYDASSPTSEPLSDKVKLQVIQTTMFEPALRITEYYNPSSSTPGVADANSQSIFDFRDDPSLNHVLSTRAYKAARAHQGQHSLTPILQGSLAILTFPTVSPQHLAAALSVLAPQKGTFPAPTRRAAPSYHEPPVQEGLRKLLLLGARVEGRSFDEAGVRWVGSIDGGIDGLRAQLVSLLQTAGVGLTSALEGLSKNLWMTMESRRLDMEEKAGGEKKE